MTREEAKELLDNLIGMISDNKESDYDTAFKMAIEALKQESMIEKIKADLEKLANLEWNTQVGSVSQGLECAIEIIEDYQEGR